MHPLSSSVIGAFLSKSGATFQKEQLYKHLKIRTRMIYTWGLSYFDLRPHNCIWRHRGRGFAGLSQTRFFNVALFLFCHGVKSSLPDCRLFCSYSQHSPGLLGAGVHQKKKLSRMVFIAFGLRLLKCSGSIIFTFPIARYRNEGKKSRRKPHAPLVGILVLCNISLGF